MHSECFLEKRIIHQVLVRGPRQHQHQLTAESQELLGYARRTLDLHTETLAAFHGHKRPGWWPCCPVQRTCVPTHLQTLDSEHGLGPLEPMAVSAFRSRVSQGSEAVDRLYELLVKTLRMSGAP